MKKIQVGIIGAGRMSGGHIKGYMSQEEVEVTALADPDAERVKKAVEEHNLSSAKTFSDYKEMLSSDLDAVSIVTPNFLHEAMAVDAMNAGLDVLCEKPMAPSAEACDRMNQVAEKSGRILMVNQSLRYNAAYAQVKKLLASGELGEVFHARLIRFGAKSPDKGWSPGATWFVDKKAGGGITNDIGIHLIDFANWCFGTHASVSGAVRTRIQGNTADDNATALIEYDNGPTVLISLSWTAPVGFTHTEFIGSKGMLTMAGSKISLKRAGQEEAEAVEPEQGITATSYAHFIQCVRDRKEPISSGRKAMQAVEITNLIHSGNGGVE